ncbi:MAG: hypothetical protein R3E97_13065 [Candidatus Eisenbacteria bacterium]
MTGTSSTPPDSGREGGGAPVVLSGRAKRWMIVLGLGLPFVLAVLCGEIAVRVLSKSGHVTPETRKAETLPYKGTAVARHCFQPGPREIPGPEEGQVYRIDNHGYRGPDFEWEKPEGTVRIVVYGGSAVFDIAASEGEDWPRQLEVALHEMGHPEVEVINAGIPGHASFDCLGRFYAEGYLLDPDFVLLYNTWNDLKYFKSDESLLHHYGAYNDTEDPRLNYQNGLDRFLCETSQLYVRLRDRHYKRSLGADLEGRTEESPLKSEFGDAGPRQFRLNVATFVDAALNAGTVPVLVTQARLITEANSEEDRGRINYKYHRLTHDALVEAFAVCDRTLEEVAGAKGVPCFAGAAEMNGHGEWFHDYIHLNPEGSKRLAEIVAGELVPLLEAEDAQRAE